MAQSKYKIVNIVTNQVIDTYGDLDISLNYQLEDLSDPSKRKNNFSLEIDIPGTKANNLLFKQQFEVNIDNINFNPKKSILVELRTGSAVLMTGYLQLTDVVKKNGEIYYSIVISGLFKNIFDILKDIRLKDLDLTEYNHTRDIITVRDSWDYKIYKNGILTQSEPGDGYVYPLIIRDPEALTSNLWILKDMLPAVYVKTLIDKMFEFVGANYTSEFFDSVYFKKLIVPYIDNSIKKTDEEVEDSSAIVGITTNALSIPVGTLDYWDDDGAWTQWSKVALNDTSSSTTEVDFKDPSGLWSGNKFVAQQSGYYNISFFGKQQMKVTGSGNWVKWNGNNSLEYYARLRVKKAGGGYQTLETFSETHFYQPTDGDKHNSPWTDDPNGLIDVSLEGNNKWLDVGDEVYVEMMYRWPQLFKWTVQGLNNNKSVKIQPQFKRNRGNDFTTFKMIPANSDVNGVTELNLNQTLPDMTCDELFNSILKMFNLLLIAPTDIDKGTYSIIPRDDYFNSRPIVKDWTPKLDRSSEVKINPMSEVDYNQFIYTYKADKDWINEDYIDETGRIYGDLKLKIDNDFSNKSKKHELIFSPTPSTNTNGRIVPHFLKEDKGDLTTTKVNPRILFYGGKLPTSNFALAEHQDTSSGVTSIVSQYYPYAGMLDHPYDGIYDLSFGRNDIMYYNYGNTLPANNLYEMFHKRKFEEVTDVNSKVLKGKFWLTEKDIAEFDFRDIIFLDEAYWRIIKITDYNPVEPTLTKVTLLKIKDQYVNELLEDITVIGDGLCPENIKYRKTNKDGVSILFSDLGAISPECCYAHGGNWTEGVCYIKDDQIGNPGNTGVVLPGGTTKWPGGVIATTLPGGIKGPKWPDVPIKDIVSIGREVIYTKDNNINFNPCVKINGTGNYVPAGTGCGTINGNGNVIEVGVKDFNITGDDNWIKKDSANVQVTGNNNTICENSSNLTVIGNDGDYCGVTGTVIPDFKWPDGFDPSVWTDFLTDLYRRYCEYVEYADGTPVNFQDGAFWDWVCKSIIEPEPKLEVLEFDEDEERLMMTNFKVLKIKIESFSDDINNRDISYGLIDFTLNPPLQLLPFSLPWGERLWTIDNLDIDLLEDHRIKLLVHTSTAIEGRKFYLIGYRY